MLTALAALWLAAASPAWAEDPPPEEPAPPGATLTVIPANETKILDIETPSTTSATTRPPATTSPPPTRATPTTTNAEVRTDFAAVRAAAEAAAEQRRRLSAEIAGLEPGLAATESALVAGQADVAARRGDVEAVEGRIVRAGADIRAADDLVARLELSADSAADAMAGRRPPVARPPAKGRTPADQAAQARADLAAALDRRSEVGRVLVDLEAQLEVARRSAGGATAELDAKAAELQRGRDALAELRRSLTAAEQAEPGASTGTPGEVNLVPAPSVLATATVPAGYRALYGRAAATCPGLPWTILAGVGAVESSHGQSTAVGVHSGENFAGARGPMQFLAATWAAYGTDGDGDGDRDVYDPADAVFGAANYLCANGAGEVTTLRNAVWHYNHADWYVDLVLELAGRY